MRVLFVNAHERLFETTNHPRHHLAPMDMGTAMGAATDAGHAVDFIETATGEIDASGLARRLESDPSELVVLRPSFEALPFVDGLIAAARPLERSVLLMGPPAAHGYRDLLSPQRATRVAGVAVGEADYVAAEVASALEEGRPVDGVAGLALANGAGPRVTAPRPMVRDLDTLPVPRHDLLVRPAYQFKYPLRPRGRLKMGYMLASRGCPYGCIFCSEVERASFGKPHRMHSPERVVTELRTLERLGVTGVYFEDDLLSLRRERLLDTCRAITASGVRISWCAQLRAGDIDDEMAEALAAAGCASVACGIESGSDRLLTFLKKGTTVEAMTRGVAALRRAGIEVVAYLIIGAPTETRGERQATLKLADQLDASIVQLHIFASYPGTEALARFPQLGAEGATKFIPARGRADQAELLDVQREFYRRFYLRPDRLAKLAWRRLPQLLSDPRGQVEAALELARYTARP